MHLQMARRSIVERSGSLIHAAWIVWILVSPLMAAEPTAQWVESPAAISPQDLYDATTPSNLDNCNVSVWRTRPPKVQFTLDLLVMDRDDAGSYPLLVDTATGDVLLRTGGLIQDAEPGVRMSLTLLDDAGYDVEFSYLGLDTFGDPITRSSDDPITFVFYGGTPANPQTSYTADYRSELNSGEINLRKRLGSQVTALAGFRFLELRENFNILSDRGGFFSSTDNDLYGFQLGGDVQLFRVRRSLVFSTVKAGVYYNNADVAAKADTPNGTISFIDDEDTVAFVGDVAVGMLIPMGPSADLRIGYQGLFLDGVGLAPDQSSDYSLFTSSGSMDESSLYYHGGFIGVDLFW
jgi:hypothetical protein